MLDAATTSVTTAWVRPDRARDVNPHRQLMAAVLQTAVDDCWDSSARDRPGTALSPPAGDSARRGSTY